MNITSLNVQNISKNTNFTGYSAKFAPYCCNPPRYDRVNLDKPKETNLMIKKPGLFKKPIVNAKMWTLKYDDSIEKLPVQLKEICKEHKLDLKNDLFFVSGLDEKNRHYTFSNAFYHDKITHDDVEQLFYLTSDNADPSEMQLRMYSIYFDNQAMDKLCLGSTQNPFEDVSKFDKSASPMFYDRVMGWSEMTDVIPESCQYDSEYNLRPIIYTADGCAIRYKNTTMDDFLLTYAETRKDIV